MLAIVLAALVPLVQHILGLAGVFMMGPRSICAYQFCFAQPAGPSLSAMAVNMDVEGMTIIGGEGLGLLIACYKDHFGVIDTQSIH